VKGSRLVPKPNDRDADYTETAYDINCGRKVLMRAKRAQLIAENITVLAEKASRIKDYLSTAEWLLRQSDADHREKGQFLLKEAQRVQRDAAERRELLRHFLAIPQDADEVCRCAQVSPLDLPPEYRRQVQVVSDD
jgi:hypothetical protein